MIVLLFLSLLLQESTSGLADLPKPGPRQPVTPLSFNGKEFVSAFNASADRVRLVMVFSPTCSMCLQAASDARKILTKHSDAKLKPLVVWTLIRRADSKRAAENASGYLPDPRAQHFWDLWKYSGKVYTKQLEFPKKTQAWDIFVIYKPAVLWKETPPKPASWMQNLHIEHGPKYTPEFLEEEIMRLIP